MISNFQKAEDKMSNPPYEKKGPRLFLLEQGQKDQAYIKKAHSDTLELSKEEMKRLGYQVIDMLVNHMVKLKDKPVSRHASRKKMEALLKEPLPEEPTHYEQTLKQLETCVFSNMMHLDHPRFFAFVSSPSNFVSVMGDLLASGYNVFSGLWMTSSGPAQIELTTLDWLKELLGLSVFGSGIFVSGGSMANLTGLRLAIYTKLQGVDKTKAVVYCSDQTHSSVEKAVLALGLSSHQLVKIPSDENFTLPVALLEKAICEDMKEGKLPFCVIANAGTTNTGAIDPIKAIHAVCEAYGQLWLHVDGAYGAAARISKQGEILLKDLTLADSLSVDPHKWLFQPYEIGCLLVKQPMLLQQAFHILPEYLKDAQPKETEVDFSNQGLQLTRGFRALKLWMSLKVFGAASFRKAVGHGIDLAAFAQTALEKRPQWQVVSAATLGILTFRYLPSGASLAETNALNKEIVEQMVSIGYAMVSSTELKGKVVLRLCIINPRTTKHDIDNTIRLLDGIAKSIEASKAIL
jgi:glutamate/tyrosine decarboxylase-like PLP-dependent enzyme